jgi:hypothetical protein
LMSPREILLSYVFSCDIVRVDIFVRFPPDLQKCQMVQYCASSVVAAAVCVAASFDACATEVKDPPQQPAFSLVEEFRLGIFDHNPDHIESVSIDGAVELLSSPMLFYSGQNQILSTLLNPRLNLGAMVNFDGKPT